MAEKGNVHRAELGNQLLCIDCMELMKQLPDCSVSLILTDPPYGIRYQNQYTTKPHLTLIGDEGIPYWEFAQESYRILRMNSHAYFFTRFDCYPYHYECLKAAGFAVKNCLIIEKGTIGGIGDLKGSYANNSEWVIFCQKGRREFNHTMLLENRKKGMVYREHEVKKYKTRFPACWFGSEYPKATYNATWQKKHGIFHPTIKNVDCLKWLIEISSNLEEIVFDGFAGTGSTAVAAIETGRRYIAAEISPKYWEIADRRIMEIALRK